MEQTNNSFGKGMQLDTNPMLQGNDSLSKCLNGTFLTQNGNELILQNDMGNRKVKDTYLPEGYIPVGIKEYGGIIYIASYNPLTNKGQIGSFPAPEQWIDNDENTDTDINFIFQTSEDPTMKLQTKTTNGNTTTYDYYNFRYLIESQKIYKVSDNLHIGDQFAFFCSGEDFKPLEISQYNAKDDPKNRKYSLNIGILNSQNIFQDITKNLIWTKNTGLIGNTYFVTRNKLQNINKNKIAYNLFSNKTTGPLALKITQNIPDYVVPTITGSLNNDVNNTANLQIELLITHNCPINQSNKYFYFLTKNNIDQNQNDNNWNNVPGTIECIEGNPTKLVMKCQNVSPTREGYLLDYFIAVPSVFNVEDFKDFLDTESNEGLLKQFCFQGTLDYRLFSTYSMDVKKWQFSTTNNSTTLNCSVDVITQSTDLKVRVVCKEVSDNSKTIIIPLTQGELTGGKYPYTVSNYILPNTTYGEAYTATIELLDQDNNVLSSINDYWILCTTLFNDANEQTITNNSEPVNNDNYVGDNYVHPTTENQEAAQQRLLTIDIDLDYDMVQQDFIDDNLTIAGSLYKIEYRESEQSGVGIEVPETLTENHELNYTYTPRMDIKLNPPEYTISNSNKYPNYILNSNITSQLNNSVQINTDAEVTFAKKVGNEWIDTDEVDTIENLNINIDQDGIIHLTGKFQYEETAICNKLSLYKFNQGTNLILLRNIDNYEGTEDLLELSTSGSYITLYKNREMMDGYSVNDWSDINMYMNSPIARIQQIGGSYNIYDINYNQSNQDYVGVTEDGIPIGISTPENITYTRNELSSIFKNFTDNQYYYPSIKFTGNNNGVLERKKTADNIATPIYERCYVYGFNKDFITFNQISSIMLCVENLVTYNKTNISDSTLNIFKFNINSENKLDINFGNNSANSINYKINNKWNPSTYNNAVNYLAEIYNEEDEKNYIYAQSDYRDNIYKLSGGIYKLTSEGELHMVPSLLKFNVAGNLEISIENKDTELEKYPNLVEKYDNNIRLEHNAAHWSIDTGQPYIIKQFIANE